MLAAPGWTPALVLTLSLCLCAPAGSPITGHEARPNMLQTHAATVELFAWLAVKPPGGGG